MAHPIFKLKQLEIPECWKIIKNDFIELEPDNTIPVDEVFYHFDNDIQNATYQDYCVDLGFCGGYLDNDRWGVFKIVVMRGDFNDGIVYEFFISRNTDEIKDKLNVYFEAIPNGQLENLQGVKYDDNYDFDSFHVFSAIDKIDYRLSDEQLEHIAKPKL